MATDVFAIAVYPVSNHFVVRRCCSSGYRMHATEGAFFRYPSCTCEILATDLSKDDAIHLGQKYSKKLNVAFILE